MLLLDVDDVVYYLNLMLKNYEKLGSVLQTRCRLFFCPASMILEVVVVKFIASSYRLCPYRPPIPNDNYD